MKSRGRWLAAVVVAALLCVLGWGASAQKQGSRKTVWEYRVVSAGPKLPEATLNELGAEGWELVGATEVGSTSERTGSLTFYLKRARQ